LTPSEEVLQIRPWHYPCAAVSVCLFVVVIASSFDQSQDSILSRLSERVQHVTTKKSYLLPISD